VDEPRFAQVHLTLAASEVDEASGALFELGAEGIEERDGGTLAPSAESGRVTLVASFPDRASAEDAVGALDPRWSPTFHELVGDAWRDAYKEHFHPFHLTEHVTIRPPWEGYDAARPDEIVLELEPGRAFGTGLHATTAGVARVLDERRAVMAGARVLDVGTGSGILLLVALALGAREAHGIDVDADAVSCAAENVARNGFERHATVRVTPLEEIGDTYDVVLANIEARVLVPMAAELSARVRAGGLLILSGILVGQEEDVRAAYRALRLDEIRRDGEWAVLVFVCPGAGNVI
jgi:ribosomal protein L11 methyltransferase